jgi:hypothetical protein
VLQANKVVAPKNNKTIFFIFKVFG